MKRTSLQLIFLLIAITALGQDRLLPGYYVTQSSDTVRGLIRYRNSYHRQIEFQQEKGSSRQTLSMSDVAAFGFAAGESYRRVSYTEEKVNHEIFARLLLDGTVDLYEHEGKYLIGKQQGKELFVLSRVKGSTGQARMPIHQKNVGTLNLLLSDCPTVQKQSPDILIGEASLSGLLDAYHKCVNSDYKSFRTMVGTRPFLLGGFAGVTTTELKFSSDHPDLAAIEFSPSQSMTVGALFLYQGKKPSPVFAIQGELSFTKASFSGDGAYENDLAGYLIRITTKTSAEYSRLSFKGGFRITGRSNVVNPYFAIGFAMYNHLSTDASMHQTIQINESVEEVESNPNIFNSNMGVWTSIGLKKKLAGNKALFVDAVYEYNSIDPGGRLTSLQYRLGLLF